MHYEFPYIKTIDDVLPAIEGRDEFSVTDKGEYTCINYNLMKGDTFPPVLYREGYEEDLAENEWLVDIDAALRRECRGIIFDNSTKKIIRRPLHKFFNLNEHEETRDVDFSTTKSWRDHVFETKRDGSMAAPFYVAAEDKIYFGTKAGCTEVSKHIDEFVERHPNYMLFAEYCIRHNWTPIFEWCSRKQRIILDYPEDELVLLAIRQMNTGEYILNVDSDQFKIPKIEVHKPEDSKTFIDSISILTGIEGFVITWPNGHKIKCKTAEYVKIHRAKDALSSENKILALYFDNQLDDLLAALSKDEQDAIRKFCGQFDAWMDNESRELLVGLQSYGDMSRKEFALTISPTINSYLRPIYFSCFENRTLEAIKKSLYLLVKKSITRNVNYDALKASIFPMLELKI